MYHCEDSIIDEINKCLVDKRNVSIIADVISILDDFFMYFFRFPLFNSGSKFKLLRNDQLVEVLSKKLRKVFIAANSYNIVSDKHSDNLNAADVVRKFFKDFPGVCRMVMGDIKVLFQHDPSACSVAEVVLCYPAVKAIYIYRISHLLFELNVPIVPRITSEVAHTLTGIDIHPGARIGRDFFIDHGTGTVIGGTCIIGDNVKLFHNVTLGALNPLDYVGCKNNRKRHPTIEDDVVIYSGATILGGDTVIGYGSVIASNAFITKSVLPNTKVMIKGHVGEVITKSV